MRVAAACETTPAQFENLGRFRSGQLQNVAEHECDPMRPIETLEHGQAAADFELVDQHRAFRLIGTGRFDPFNQVIGESLEREVEPLDSALLQVEV